MPATEIEADSLLLRKKVDATKIMSFPNKAKDGMRKTYTKIDMCFLSPYIQSPALRKDLFATIKYLHSPNAAISFLDFHKTHTDCPDV